jgi:hypothetical protein
VPKAFIKEVSLGLVITSATFETLKLAALSLIALVILLAAPIASPEVVAICEIALPAGVKRLVISCPMFLKIVILDSDKSFYV